MRALYILKFCKKTLHSHTSNITTDISKKNSNKKKRYERHVIILP